MLLSQLPDDPYSKLNYKMSSNTMDRSFSHSQSMRRLDCNDIFGGDYKNCKEPHSPGNLNDFIVHSQAHYEPRVFPRQQIRGSYPKNF
jgi:hypothetical protein